MTNLQPLPATVEELRSSKYLDLMGPALMESGADKLQVYYVGPKDASILRATPYNDQATHIRRTVSGPQRRPEFLGFLFPGSL